MKEELENVIEALSNSFCDESDREHADYVQKLIVKNSHLDIQKPELFSLFVRLEIDTQTDLLSRNVAKTKGVEQDRRHIIMFAYKHYDFIVSHLKSLLLTYEGNSCSTDKTRWLIDTYVEYLQTKEVPNITEKKYWHPRVLDIPLWMAFIESTYKLYYGDEEGYVVHKQTLIAHYKDIIAKKLDLLHGKFLQHPYFFGLEEHLKNDDKKHASYLFTNPSNRDSGTIILNTIGDISYRYFFSEDKRYSKYGDTLPDWFSELLN